MRERELIVFQSALASLKSAAAYTGGDLYALLSMCRENAFLAEIPQGMDIPMGWKSAAERFFSCSKDRAIAEGFINGYGRTDLSGLLSYITLFETRVQAVLDEARQDVTSKCKLYTMLGLFTGTVTALLLV